jgi:hypothetical protein
MKMAARMNTGQIKSTGEWLYSVIQEGIYLPQVRERRGRMQALGSAAK